MKPPHSAAPPPATATRRPRSRTTPLLSRLMGMETEYATLVADPQNLAPSDLPTALFVYQQICEAIRRDQPTAPGVFDQEQMFLASGAAVTFESQPWMSDAPGGLIELATPEVRGPDELLACQRSLDQLVSEATAAAETSYDLRVLKNSSDARGHVYGCQENYEAEVARGAWLVIYRGFVLLLWVMQLVSLVVSLPPLWVMVFSGWLVRRRHSPPHTAAPPDTLEPNVEPSVAGDDHDRNDDASSDEHRHHIPVDDRIAFDAVPRPLAWGGIHVLRLIHLPTVLVLRFVARYIAFRPQRRYLIALLASRLALCASGSLDHRGRYRLSAKAMAIDVITDIGGFRGERPVFVFGHWLAQYCANPFLSLGSTRAMLARRQRLQIGLSDSNMADQAEYVKFASVSLVLDMIEAGEVADLPILKQGVSSIHRIASDWNLVSRVPTSRGEMSALEIQRSYRAAAERFVAATSPTCRGEATTVLERWESLLTILAAFRQDHHDTAAAIGRVDWLTKRILIDALGDNAAWTDKKKIDLRYHELSSDGYFSQLLLAKPEVLLVDPDQVRRRRRSPPAGTPAARRGWLIREFASGDEGIQTDWTYALIGRGGKRKRVDFEL